jgi:hypothetical protein
MLSLVNTECCAYQPIEGLKHFEDPVDAMKSFCKQVLYNKPRFRTSEIGREGTIYAFYIFSAPVGGSYDLPGANRYGHKFAELIVTEGLGKVWSTEARKNDVFHPDHANIVWVWAPERVKLVEWMKKKEGK